MFWKRKPRVLPEPFQGSAFDYALEWCREHQQPIKMRDHDHFDILLGDGQHRVHVERSRHLDPLRSDVWLDAWAEVPGPAFPVHGSVEEKVKAYQALAKLQLEYFHAKFDYCAETGKRIARFNRVLPGQAQPDFLMKALLETFLEQFNLPLEPYFVHDYEIFVGSRRFYSAFEAFSYFITHVKADRVAERRPNMLSFEVGGGLACSLLDLQSPALLALRNGYSDFQPYYGKTPEITLDIEEYAAKWRREFPRVISIADSTGARELSITNLISPGTDATTIFHRTLAEVHDAVLASAEFAHDKFNAPWFEHPLRPRKR